MKRTPNITSHQVLVILSLVEAFKFQYVLVAVLILLFCVCSLVLLKFFKMQDMDYCAVGLDQNLNQLHLVFTLWLLRKPCGIAVLSCFLLLNVLLGALSALQDRLYLWSNEDKCVLSFAWDNSGKTSWSYLKAADFLSRLVTEFHKATCHIKKKI